MATLHLQVVGKVQGVGFRWFTRVAARKLQLSGWVTNRRDGTVEIAAAGRPEKLDEFRRLLQQGPEGAQVESLIDLSPIDSEELAFPFVIDKSGMKKALR